MARQKITHERRHIGLRIEILDELLGSIKRRNYTDLLEALNDKLVEKGEVPIKERTLKYDITYLIDKKGAPIHRPVSGDSAVYYQEKFSLKMTPVDEDDISFLKQAVSILKKATDIKLIIEIDNIIAKLENKIHTNVPDSNTMIAFEEHTQASGREYIDPIFSAIQEKCPIKFTYQPFGKEEREWMVHPYMLKEYRNRWFLIGRVGCYPSVSNIALDRIKGKIKNSSDTFLENNLFDPESYFNNLIGVTIPREQNVPTDIQIKVSPASADYIKTKPIHKGQQTLRVYKDGSLLIQVTLYINFELKSYLLSYGVAIEVVKPKELRAEMKEILDNVIGLYK